MRGFLALLRKEWNDVRVITFACMALVVVALLLIRWLMQRMTVSAATDPNWGPRFLEFVVPFAVGGFVTLAAADLVGREIESRRIDALALLPARPIRIWTAKATVLVAAVLTFAVFTVVAQVMVLWAVDGMDAAFPFLERRDQLLAVAFPIAALAGATFLVSSVGFRGIGAAALGVLLTGGLFGLAYAYFLRIGIRESQAFGGDRILGASTTIAVAAFVAAAAVYARGRLHLGKKLRPAFGAVATFGLVALVPAVAYPHSLYACDPREPGSRLVWVLPAPDGRSLACTFYRENGGVTGTALHVLDVESGELREIGTRTACDTPSGENARAAWVDDTHLRVLRYGFTSVRHDIVDTRDGSTVKGASESLGEYRARLSTESAAPRPASGWQWNGSRTVKDGAESFHVASLRRSSDGRDVDVRSVTATSTPWGADKIVLCPDRHHLVERDLETGADRVVLACEGRIEALWHTGRADGTVYLRIGDTWEAVRVSDGSRVPFCTGARVPMQALCAGSDRRFVWVPDMGARPMALVDIDSGDRLEPCDHCHLSALPDGRLLLFGYDGTCDLLDARLERIRRLWPQAGR